MVDPISIETNPILKFKGIYDYDGFYKLIRKYFENRKYVVIEKRYKDKAGDFGNEVEMFIDPYKEVDEFVKYNLELQIKVFDIKEFETTINGQKKKVTDGKLILKMIKAEVEFDWQGNYKRSNLTKKLVEFMVTKLFKKYYLIRYVAPFRNDVQGFYAAVREHLDMESS